MWWRKCVCCVLFLALHQVSGEYDCYVRGNNISCTALTEEDLRENMTVSLSKHNINTVEELRILDSYLLTIKKDTFKYFKSLQGLYLQSTRTNYIEENAFADLINLKSLYLTDNYLGQINTNMFPINNTVDTLDLSQNLLNNLSDFDINVFPALTLLNISHNKLEYLPENIVNKLKEENKFYLVIDNNPWNCAHAAWNQHLTTLLIEAFCRNNNYDPRSVEEKLERLDSGYLSLGSDTEIPPICSKKCTFNQCLWWTFGALWLGIITGNLCKIKRLLFTTPTRFEDKTTQCDRLDLLSKG